ncbi:MAG: hypothetical protein ACUVUG_04285 [Candidatus Aminicenantia bacterium]
MEEKKITSLLGIEIFQRDGKLISTRTELLKEGHSLKDEINIFISFIDSMKEIFKVEFSELFIKLKDYCGIFLMQDKLFVAHCKDEDVFEYVERMIETL